MGNGRVTNKARNTVERFKCSEEYQRASESENSDETCEVCSFLFTFNGKTRCYAYEQQRFKDNNEFNPQPDYNCILFDDTENLYIEIKAYKNALANRPDPENDSEYKSLLKEDNEKYEVPKNCSNCADDECPMNKC
jgi:hypothetical protein